MQQIVYILGSSRSGSTMLDLIISSHPSCASLGELLLIGKRNCGYCGLDCKEWEKYGKIARKPGYYKFAFEVFKKPILVDSSKKWKWLIKRAKNEPYPIKVIHLVRNGLDRLKAKKQIDGKIKPETVMAWVNTHRKCEEIRKKMGGILIRYEQIPDKIVDICNFIGISFRSSMKAFWRQEHHGLLGSKTAYALVKAYHSKKDHHGEFASSHGFNIEPRTGHDFLSDHDLKIFKQHKGEALNKRLGYG